MLRLKRSDTEHDLLKIEQFVLTPVPIQSAKEERLVCARTERASAWLASWGPAVV